MCATAIHGSKGMSHRARRCCGCFAATGLVLLVVLLLAPGQARAAGWTKQYYQTYGLTDIQFVDAQHGWAVGGNGSIVATANGGAAWKAQASGTTEMLQAVDFVDAQYGWAVGSEGTILATTNGGVTWTKQSSGYNEVLWGVSFANRSQGWACGYWGAILRTTNGGATWTRVVWPFGDNLWITDNFMGVAAADGSHAFIAGGDVIAWAVTGTPPWQYAMPDYYKDNYEAVDCSSATSAVVVGSTTASTTNRGVAYITRDGSTWTKVTAAPATTESFWDVSMPSANTICIAGSNCSVWVSTDAGATWKSYGRPSLGYGSIDFLSATQGWAIAGPGGSIYRYGATATARPVPLALANVSVRKGARATLPYRVSSSAATCTATIKIVRNGKVFKTFTIKQVRTNVRVVKRFRCTLAKGRYTWKVSAVARGVKSARASSKRLTVK